MYTQWEFQDPKMEVPSVYTAYFSGLNFREYHHKIWPYMLQYLHFWILEFPLIYYIKVFVVVHMVFAIVCMNGMIVRIVMDWIVPPIFSTFCTSKK